jgi:pimeloyl-ACP methyl ester carboxylesterase
MNYQRIAFDRVAPVWLLDALEMPKAHLVGNSFGCQIIAEFALRYPQRIDRRLVLQGPKVDPSARSFGKQLNRLIINSRREQRSMGRITLKDYRAAGLHVSDLGCGRNAQGRRRGHLRRTA